MQNTIKKISAVIFTLCLLCFIETKGQALTFRNTYPGIAVSSASQTSDHGYIIAGYSTTYSIGSKDIVLIKTDSTGAITWSTTFGNKVNANADDIPANAVEIPGAAGYYLAGQFWNQGNGSYEVYVLKTDAGGNRLWSKTMYNGGYDKGMHVENAAGGGCLVIGWLGNSSRGYLCRLDANGIIVWQNMINYPLGSWILQSGRPTPDGGMINGGYDNELGTYEMWLMKTDGGGSITWQRGYAMNATYNFCYDVCRTSDNGYLAAGGSSGINLVKTDSSGNLLWAQTYSGVFGTNRAYSVKQCADTGYIVLANDLNNNQYLMKTDSSGNVLWTMKYTGGYYLNTVEQTTDGGYVLAMGSDIIKTDANGYTGCGDISFTLNASLLPIVTRTPSAFNTAQAASNTAADSSTNPIVIPSYCFTTGAEETASESSVIIFPNPAADKLSLIGYPLSGKCTIEIYNAVGAKVKYLTLNPSAKREGLSASINISELNRGIYFVRIISEKESVTKKIIVVR